MALPTIAFTPGKTVVANKSYAVFQPAGSGSPPAVELVGKLANYEQSVETIKREVPGDDKILRPDRVVAIRQTEAFKFEVEEMSFLVSLFGGLSGYKVGTVTLFICDPDDAATKVKIKTNAFKCTATLEGGIAFQSGQFSKGTINFEATEKVTFTIDGDA